jgi:23S rRNA pseudouridine2605 synthase
LARALSKLGYCSRSQAEILVRAGRVQVNDAVRRNPKLRVNPARDRISVDGRVLRMARKVYLMLNKPRGLVTSAADERGRATVYECLADPSLPWLFPVGRLDRASEGLLLFTNDTGWAARILEPASHLDKRYHVQVDCLADEQLLRQVVVGVVDGDDLLQARQARLLRHGRRNSWVEIVLDEGKNRQIRRMMGGLGVAVLRLVRVAIGPLELGNLDKGAYRHLTAAERDALSRSAR